MSFGCQLKLCRKAESERFLGLIQINVLLVRIQSGKSGRVGENVDRNANDWTVFEPASLRNTSVFKCARECLTSKSRGA